MKKPNSFEAAVPVRGLYRQHEEQLTFRATHSAPKLGHDRPIALRPEDAAEIEERLQRIGAPPPDAQPA
jgi:hypothetical protein